MSVPDVFDLTLPVLELLVDGSDKSTRSLAAAVGTRFGLTQADLELTRHDGRSLVQDRVEWARTWLRKAALIEYPRPGRSRITPSGVQLLTAQPRRLDREYFVTGSIAGSLPPSGSAADQVSGYFLEDELRRLCGVAVARDEDWEAVRALNGWGPDDPMTYNRAARLLRRDKDALLSLGRACRVQRPDEAPLLEATLALALSHVERDPDDLALDLVMLGFTRDTLSLLGLCEAARRFGRFDEWRALLGYFSRHARPGRRKPRPFESWFELDVFLQLQELGYEVQPQRRIGRYRVDMYLPDFVPPVIVECDGDRYHRVERAAYDESREDWLRARHTLVRFRYLTYREKPEAIREGLDDVLRQLGRGRQLRLA